MTKHDVSAETQSPPDKGTNLKAAALAEVIHDEYEAGGSAFDLALVAMNHIQPELDAAFQRGFEAGQRSIDEAVASVTHGESYVLSLYWYDGEWGAQQQIEYFEEAPTGTNVCGHGDTPTIAILDACEQAKEAK